MELARLEYNNSVEDDTWRTNKSRIEKDTNILALATQLLANANINHGNGTPKPTPGEEGRQFQAWRFENPKNEATKQVRGTTMRWCAKDCHPQPMWCGRPNCLSRSEYAEAMARKRQGGGKQTGNKNESSKPKLSNDFRIILAALTTPEDFASLEDQFFSGKD